MLSTKSIIERKRSCLPFKHAFLVETYSRIKLRILSSNTQLKRKIFKPFTNKYSWAKKGLSTRMNQKILLRGHKNWNKQPKIINKLRTWISTMTVRFSGKSQTTSISWSSKKTLLGKERSMSLCCLFRATIFSLTLIIQLLGSRRRDIMFTLTILWKACSCWI